MNMREDMFKVIVERPRLVNSNPYSRDGRRYRNQEDTPLMLGMKRGYDNRNWLNENLAPLRRYLESQVNRPWNKVYSDICATIDSRSTVKQHILQHIDDFVAINTRVVDGEIMVPGGWRIAFQPLKESRYKLFVDPRTGILRRNRFYKSWGKVKRERSLAQQAELSMVRRAIDEHRQLHRIDGIWYEVELAVLPEPRVILVNKDGQWVKQFIFDKCRDVIRKEWVSRKHACSDTLNGKPSNQTMYGNPNVYARAKRQLGSRELEKFGLQS
jgi:hypothetical protein